MTHIIIGGGIMGLLTAYYLAATGEKVTVLEQGKLGQESSWAGGGILSPLYPWHYPEPLNELAGWSQQHYRDLVDELKATSGIDAQWQQCGFLILDPEEIESALGWAQQTARHAETINRDFIQRLAPNLSPQQLPDQAIWMPNIAQVRNPRLLKALITTLRMKPNVELREQCPATDLNIANQRITGVVCGNDELTASTVTIACGAWSKQLLKTWAADLAVEPVRGQMVLFKADPELLTTMVMRKARYLIPRLDGRIIAGSTLEYVGFDKHTTDLARNELTAFATTLVPRLADYPIEHHWSGLRPGNSTQVPVISQHPTISGLFVNTGHFRNGVVTAPASCKLCADLILNKSSILDPIAFSL